MSKVIQVMNASNKKEVQELLKGIEVGIRYQLLKSAINRINTFIDNNIHVLSEEIILGQLRHVVVLEDEVHIVERYILKRAVNVYDL